MKGNPYESERYLHEYLLFHYGKPKDLCPHLDHFQDILLRFHERIDGECIALPFKQRARALDLGCSVGRFAFHWYRRDCNGFWSHKVGNSPARNVDESGQTIVDPQACDRGTYSVFCGFFICDPTIVTVF